MYQDTNKLIVWQRSHDLVLEIYKLTKQYPMDEKYGLVSQLRRASVSVPSNIVEGKARGSKKDYLRFLMISRGSLEEVKYQLLLSKDLGYITKQDYQESLFKAEGVGRLLHSLIVNLKAQIT